MTDWIAEIALLAAKRLELIASLTPDGTHFSDWYQRQRDELLWTNARLADTVPELLDALDAAAAQQAALVAAINTVLDDEETGAGGWGPDVTMVAVLRDALKQATGGASGGIGDDENH